MLSKEYLPRCGFISSTQAKVPHMWLYGDF